MQPIAHFSFYGWENTANGRVWTEGEQEVFTFPELAALRLDLERRGLRFRYDWTDYWKRVVRHAE